MMLSPRPCGPDGSIAVAFCTRVEGQGGVHSNESTLATPSFGCGFTTRVRAAVGARWVVDDIYVRRGNAADHVARFVSESSLSLEARRWTGVESFRGSPQSRFKEIVLLSVLSYAVWHTEGVELASELPGPHFDPSECDGSSSRSGV